MPGDPRVDAAISHWAPRFIANGVVYSDFVEVTQGIERWEQWCAAWSARALVHERLGEEALAGGHRLSAGEHLTRAGVYYHFAKFLFVDHPQEMRKAHMRAVECRNRALRLVDPQGERVAIPYEGKSLAGILRKPAEIVRPPCVVMVMGLDSAKEEMDAYERVFLERGLATLAFDGPGQGEAEYDFAIRGDYEVPVRAVVDWLGARGDVDAARLGLWGVSLGGYYAPRAAAFEPRIKACIALSGPYDWGDAWERLPSLTRAAFRARSHARSDDEARAKAATLTLKNAAHHIACPLFIVAGRLDRLVPASHAERLAAEAKGSTTLLMIEDGGHVANNRAYRYRTQSADWMAERLRK